MHNRVTGLNGIRWQYDIHGRTTEQDNALTTRFVWDGYRLLQGIHDGTPLTYVYSGSQCYETLARIDGVESPEIYWFHNAANGMPERLTDSEGQKAWEGINSPWGKSLRESSKPVPVVEQNLHLMHSCKPNNPKNNDHKQGAFTRQ